MRKYVVSVATSLDGYYRGRGKELDAIPIEDAFNAHNLALLREAQTLVFGSNWFVDNWQFWSGLAAEETVTARNLETATLVTSLESVIISDSMTIEDDDPWAATARVVPRDQAPDEIARLKQGDGGNLLTFGSSITWNPLLRLGLVDELIVLVGAALAGEGTSLYSGSRAGLRLLEARVLPDSELVELRYDASRAGPEFSGRDDGQD